MALPLVVLTVGFKVLETILSTLKQEQCIHWYIIIFLLLLYTYIAISAGICLFLDRFNFTNVQEF